MRCWLAAAGFGVALLPGGATASAQTPPQEIEGRNAPGAGIGAAVGKVFARPLHPVLKDVASGGGPGAGIGYDAPLRGRWRVSAEAVATVNRYWSALLIASYERERARVDAYGRLRHMSRLNFFGPGADSAFASRTHFRLREPIVGVTGSVRPLPAVTVGGRLEHLWPDVGPAGGERVPSIETRFDEHDAPGLERQPRFGRYQAFVETITDADPVGALYQGGRTRVTFSYFDDRQLDRYDFRRVELETQHRFTVLGPHRTLTLHGWISTTDANAGGDVPFFLQRTLGGKGQLHSIGERLIGTDGTSATLRGFRTFRFRDRHLLLLQAEYRVPLWGPVDATVFVDAGKVASRRRDLDLSGLQRSYGFSLGVVRASGTLARMDVGFGGGEGVHVFWTFGWDSQ